MKYNPFRPNSMIAPGMFHGRYSELKAVEQALFQTANGNPSHFLIQGERGIGKSSLLLMVKSIAEGVLGTFDGRRFQFLVLSVDLGSSNTQLDIVRAIGRELKTVLAEKDQLRARAKAFWDWCTNWEVLGVRYHKDAAEFDPEDAADQLVSKIAELCNTLADQIDEGKPAILVFLGDGDDEAEVALDQLLERVRIAGADLSGQVDLFRALEQRVGADFVEVLVQNVAFRLGRSDPGGSGPAAAALQFGHVAMGLARWAHRGRISM